MNAQNEYRKQWAERLSRRWFLRDCGLGVGASALHSLLANDLPGKEARTHFAAKAKRVVYLFHAGAPSHLELFDPKPELTKRDGQLPPVELLKDYRAALSIRTPNSSGPSLNFGPMDKAELS